MAETLRLMCVLAHPDDESLGTGGILAKYAAEGIETFLVTATRGELGWTGAEKDYPGQQALGKIREAELRAAAEVLGLQQVVFLDYIDGSLDRAKAQEAIAKIVSHIRRVRPHVVVTFDANGAYGHPDHIAICQFTTAAIAAAADPNYEAAHDKPAHLVSKLYYFAVIEELAAAYQAAFGDLIMTIDGMQRGIVSWPHWAITTQIDTADYWEQVWEAITCHRTQLPGYESLQSLTDEHHRNLWGQQHYYRAFSLVNGGREIETDLFAGLRAATDS